MSAATAPVTLFYSYAHEDEALRDELQGHLKLLERRGLSAKDLWPVIGSKGRVSEILSGKREISKEQARMLAEFFGVRMVLFL